MREMEQQAARLPRKDQDDAFRRINELKMFESRFKQMLEQKKSFHEMEVHFQRTKIDNWQKIFLRWNEEGHVSEVTIFTDFCINSRIPINVLNKSFVTTFVNIYHFF